MKPSSMPTVSKICIYPIKSLDGVEVKEASVLRSGALQGDREFAMFDEQGKFVNGKRNPKVHQLRTKFILESKVVSLQIQGSDEEQSFHLEEEKAGLEGWLSSFFGFTVKVRQNLLTGVPDDTVSTGPTIVSNGTLKEVASWYSHLDENDVRRQLRSTIEIDGVSAFWEDRLFSQTGDVVPFQIGNLNFFGVNPCQRCIVFARDAVTGKTHPKFQKIFITKRQETLPQWVTTSRFDHFYKLTVNTRLASSEVENQVIRVGDKVNLIS